MTFVSPHKKLHIAELWREPQRPADAALYSSLYREAVAQGLFPEGTEVNFSVPAVDRGLFLAALEARRGGLPVNRVIAACNENRVLLNALRTGVYAPDDAPRQTACPLLDVGRYAEAEALLALPPAERALFAAYGCPEKRWQNMRDKVRETAGVALAPSTAVAYVALQDHRCVTADGLQAIVLSLEEG